MRKVNQWSWDENDSSDQQTFQDLKDKASDAAQSHALKMIKTFSDTYFETMKTLTQHGVMDQFQYSSVMGAQVTGNMAGAMRFL